MPQNHPPATSIHPPLARPGVPGIVPRRICASVWMVVGLAGFAASLVTLGGCEMPSGEGRLLGASSDGTQATAVADWDDIEAAMDVAISKLEMAVEARPTREELRSDGRGASTVTYQLVTIRDEPARVTFSRNKSLAWS
ncbi:MAG: hypothetical protein SFY95_00285, partial [Planctomycetota bacterium]|nr:hypothetical protein [Planctomycetota bacterium]